MSEELHPGMPDFQQVEDLLKLDLGIGDALQLQDTAGDRQRYYVKLIGFMDKSGIVVSHPYNGDVPQPVDDGQSFSVRGFSGRMVYEFNANVLASSMVPYPHLHLSFPDKIECMTMRNAMRIRPKSLIGWGEPMGHQPGVVKLPMVVVDISTSGALVHAKRKLGNIDDLITVVFRLPENGEEQTLSVLAVIRTSSIEKLPDQMGGAEVMTYGLEFMNPSGHVRMALQGYIYKTMAEGH